MTGKKIPHLAQALVRHELNFLHIKQKKRDWNSNLFFNFLFYIHQFGIED